MQKQKIENPQELEKLDQLVYLAQQSFILHALQAGISTEVVRGMLKIDYQRVIKISKQLQQAQKKQKKTK